MGSQADDDDTDEAVGASSMGLSREDSVMGQGEAGGATGGVSHGHLGNMITDKEVL